MTLTEEFASAVRDLRALRKRDIVMFVLRHAESAGQGQQELYKTLGDYHLPITRLGVRQANAAGDILAGLIAHSGLENARLISSTGHRSTRTMVEIFTHLAPDTYVNVDPRLDKQKFGDFDGLFTSAEREAACPEGFKKFQKMKEKRGLFYARPPNGESMRDVQKRMTPFFEERAERGGVTIAVTHGTNALCLEDIALGRGVKWIIDRLDTRPNCAIRMITGNRKDGFTARTICTDPIATRAALAERAPVAATP